MSASFNANGSFDQFIDYDHPVAGLSSGIAKTAKAVLKVVTGHRSTALTGLEDEKSYITDMEWSEALQYKPRTPFGKRLMEIRKKIIASGEPLLDWDDIEHEIAESRGEFE